MSIPKHLLFTANSPGEIAGWLRPLVKQARIKWPQTKISVILLPCPFATGSEQRIAEEELGVDKVWPARSFFSLLAYGLRDCQGAALVHLGGDLMYAAALAWRWKLSAWSYLWGRWWWDKAFKGYFIKNSDGLAWLQKHKLPDAKALIVGDLVADSVKFTMDEYLLTHPALPANPNLITFMPGSRLHELAALAPFFLETAQALQKHNPALQFQMLVSPFIKPGKILRALESEVDPAMGGIKGQVQGDALVNGNTAISIIRKHHMPHLSQSRLCITIPGTKTAEAACLGVPQLMVLPLNRPDKLPFIGLIGLLDWVPGGEKLKGHLLLKMRNRITYLSQPNILAKHNVMPELIDVLSPTFVAVSAACLLHSQEQQLQQKQDFSELYTPSLGTAERILATIEGAL